MLSQRLKQLERLGVVTSAPKPDGRGHHYELTSAGHDLFTVCQSLGEWGARWLEIAPENLDPFVALWSMCHALRRDRLPDRRVVIRFDFTGRPRPERYWLLIELGDTEICKTYHGLDEDLYITAEAEAFVKWHAGQLTWAQATREGRIQLDGLPSLARAFPTWNARSMFAHIRPVSRSAPRRLTGVFVCIGSPPSPLRGYGGQVARANERSEGDPDGNARPHRLCQWLPSRTLMSCMRRLSLVARWSGSSSRRPWRERTVSTAARP